MGHQVVTGTQSEAVIVSSHLDTQGSDDTLL